MGKKRVAVALSVAAALLFFLSAYTMQQAYSRSHTGPVHYSCAVFEDADSPVFYAYISHKDVLQNYFDNLEKTLEEAEDFSGAWVLRITLTDSVSGIGTDTISIPSNARTKVILVGTSEIQIGQNAYQSPADTDIVAYLRNWSETAQEGTYSHLNFEA